MIHMKTTLFLTSVLALALAPAGAAPADMAGKRLVVEVNGAQEAYSDSAQQPTQWQPCHATPLVLHFPTDCNNCYSYQLQEGSPDFPWPPNSITYAPGDSAITLTGNGLSITVQLAFSSDTQGKADIVWHEESSRWWIKGATFTLQTAAATAGVVTLPRPEATAAPRPIDDGLGDLVRSLEKSTYKTAVERLYQKRLLILLPQIMQGAPIDTTLNNANNSTSLHYACGLSHVGIVQWLVDHGADLNAKTAKGARVDDCVGGKNAKAIRAILRKAKAKAAK